MKMLQLLLLVCLSTIIVASHAGEEWMYPPGCDYANTCLYIANWTIDEQKDLVKFEVKAKQTNKTWTAIGFTNDKKMDKTDIVYAYLNSKGVGVVFDGWMQNRLIAPSKDPVQKLVDQIVTHTEGYLHLAFSHHRISYGPREYNFTDNDCYYFVFPVEGGSYLNDDGVVNKHYRTPKVSDEKICFRHKPDGLEDVTTVVTSLVSESVSMLSSECLTTSEEEVLTTVTPGNIEDMSTTLKGKLDESKGKWVYPPLCELNLSCLYMVEWELFTEEDVKFIIVAKQPEKTWTGIGFSDDKEMKNGADFIYGFATSGGKTVAYDAWISDPLSPPEKDKQDDLIDPNVEYKDGLLNMTFIRKRHTNDSQDKCFTDVECHFFLFPVGGGEVNYDETDMKKKPIKPIFSDNKICIRNLEEEILTTEKTPGNIEDVTMTTESSMFSESSNLMVTGYEPEVEKLKELVEPKGCKETNLCLYRVWWLIGPSEDMITFHIEARQEERTWTGVGFSNDKNADYGADFYYGYLKKNGEEVVLDGWLSDLNSKPEKDNIQDLVSKNISYVDGLLRMSFTHRRKPTHNHDLGFTDEDCLHFILPVEGGKITYDESDILKPLKPLKVTKKKICFREVVSTEMLTESTQLEDFTETTMEHKTTLSELITIVTKEPSNLISRDYKRTCYYSNTAQDLSGEAKFVPENIDASLCTHLIFAFAKIVKNKLVPSKLGDPIPGGLYERFNNLKQDSDVKTLLSVGECGAGTTPMTIMLKTEESRKEFIMSAIALLRKHNFDGLDLHFKYPGSRGSPPEDKERYTCLVKEARREFDKEGNDTGKLPLLLVAAVPAEKDIIDMGYEVDKISKDLDFINLMAYDFYNGSEPETGHHAPLFAAANLSTIDAQKNMAWAANYWVLLGAPKEKLIIGMATFGRGFALQDPSNHGLGAPTTGPSPAGPYTNELGYMAYYEICLALDDYAATRVWLPDEKVPYLYNRSIWMGYDDRMSLAIKVNWLKDSGYGGWMVWRMDSDDFNGTFCKKDSYPLIRTLYKTLMGNFTTLPMPVTRIHTNTHTMMHNTETEPKEHYMTTIPEAVTCEGHEDGSYKYPGNCTMYIRCLNKIAEFRSCDRDTYFDPTTATCTFRDSLSEERKKECFPSR